LPRQTSADICFRIIEGKCDFGLFDFIPPDNPGIVIADE
jgi:hypothetical protein